MLFYNSSAPTGWTANNGNPANERALRIVKGNSGSGGSFSSGGVSFTTIFGSSKYTNNHVLTTAQIPAHFHYVFRNQNGGQQQHQSNLTANNYPAWGTGAGNKYETYNIVAANNQPNVGRSQEIGSSQGHSHLMPLNIRYTNMILCTKS